MARRAASKVADKAGQSPRILVTNDDGYGAPGIRVLERIAKALSKDVWVVAPEVEQSATSHSLTLRRPLRVRKHKPRHFTVDGTPTDCVLVAAQSIMKDRKPDIVLSGINMGSNLGEDVTYSGTVAAAMEAALLGMRAIAFSQVRGEEGKLDFEAAEAHGPTLVQRLLAAKWHREVLINVNFPALSPKAVRGIRVCRQGRRESGTTVAEGRDPSGRPYVWVGQFLSDDTPESDTDLKAVIEGMISVTPLHLDLTHATTLRELGELFPERR
jgi:5'-nucleotidase